MNFSYSELVEIFLAVGLVLAGVKVFSMGFEGIGGLLVAGALFLMMGVAHGMMAVPAGVVAVEVVPWRTVFLAMGHMLQLAGIGILLVRIEQVAMRNLMTARVPLDYGPVVPKTRRVASGEGVVGVLREEKAEVRKLPDARDGLMTKALRELFLLIDPSERVREAWGSGSGTLMGGQSGKHGESSIGDGANGGHANPAGLR